MMQIVSKKGKSFEEGRRVVAYPRPAFSVTNKADKLRSDQFMNKSKFLKSTNRTKIRKIEIPRSMVVEALS